VLRAAFPPTPYRRASAREPRGCLTKLRTQRIMGGARKRFPVWWHPWAHVRAYRLAIFARMIHPPLADGRGSAAYDLHASIGPLVKLVADDADDRADLHDVVGTLTGPAAGPRVHARAARHLYRA